MNRFLLRELQDRRCYPSVTILVNLTAGAKPTAAQLSTLRSLASEADRRLDGDVPDLIREHVRTNVSGLIDELSDKEARHAVALCVSPERTIVVELGQAVSERLIIDETFATRDLVADLNRTISFRVVAISERQVRLLSGDRDRLVEQRTDGWPMAAPQDASIRAWQRTVDAALKQLQRVSPLPTVLAGVDKTVRARVYGANLTAIGVIAGNHDRTPWEDLHEQAWDLVQHWLVVEHARAIKQLDTARSAKRYAGGVNEIWTLARQGRIATLVVEETFEVAVRIDTQDQVQPTSDVTAPDVIDDIVDETIEVVLQRGGNVVIVPDGTLSSHDRIAAVVRY